MKYQKKLIEELLEAIYVAAEEGKAGINDVVLDESHFKDVGSLSALFAYLQQEGYITLEGERIELTSSGEEIARGVVRRHRLAERLLHDILDVKNTAMEGAACEFEHILSPEITDKVCTLLGHPPTCPHGKKIPPGECCKYFQNEISPITIPLSKLKPGKKGRVAFITTGFRERFRRLTSMGVVPDAIITLLQTRPSVLIKVGETELAIDKEIADGIFVIPRD